MQCPGRIPCNGDVERVPEVLYVAADLLVRVSGLSGIVDQPYDHLSIRTIVWSECMDMCSH